MSFAIRHPVILAIVLASTGCAVTHDVGSDSKKHDFPAFTVNGDVTVVNAQTRQFETLKLSGTNYTVDMIEIIENAKTIIEAEISAAKHSNTQGKNKTINLTISDIRVTGLFKCTMYIRIDLGDGQSRGVEANGKSWLIDKAVNDAIYDIPDKVLRSVDVLKYIES